MRMASQTQKSRNGMEWRREGRKEGAPSSGLLAAWAGKISREEWMAWGRRERRIARNAPRVRDSRNELWDCFFTVPTTHHNCMH